MPGQIYILSFSATGGTWNGADNHDTGTVSFGSWSTIFTTGWGDIQDRSHSQWKQYSYKVQATGATTALQFTTNQCVQVDDVQVRQRQ